MWSRKGHFRLHTWPTLAPLTPSLTDLCSDAPKHAKCIGLREIHGSTPAVPSTISPSIWNLFFCREWSEQPGPSVRGAIAGKALCCQLGSGFHAAATVWMRQDPDARPAAVNKLRTKQLDVCRGLLNMLLRIRAKHCEKHPNQIHSCRQKAKP